MNELAGLTLLVCSYFAPIETDLGHSREAVKLHREEVKLHRYCMKEAPAMIKKFAQDCNTPGRYDANRKDYDEGKTEHCSTIK